MELQRSSVAAIIGCGAVAGCEACAACVSARIPARWAASTWLRISASNGDTTSVGNRLYVLSPDGARIHVVSRSLAEAVGLPLDTLRAEVTSAIPAIDAAARAIIEAVKHIIKVETATEPKFQDYFVAAMKFPTAPKQEGDATTGRGRRSGMRSRGR